MIFQKSISRQRRDVMTGIHDSHHTHSISSNHISLVESSSARQSLVFTTVPRIQTSRPPLSRTRSTHHKPSVNSGISAHDYQHTSLIDEPPWQAGARSIRKGTVRKLVVIVRASITSSHQTPQVSVIPGIPSIVCLAMHCNAQTQAQHTLPVSENFPSSASDFSFARSCLLRHVLYNPLKQGSFRVYIYTFPLVPYSLPCLSSPFA